MKLYYSNSDCKDADVIILGLPYDQTSSFLPGSRYGPEFIRICSENIEDYSPYQDESLSNVRICDCGDVEFDTKDWVLKARTAVKEYIDKQKYLIALGGEHTITLPIIQVLKKRHKDFSLVHIDAHCDLRDEYLEQKICHATIMRRVSDIIGFDNLYQFGIRSGTREEFNFGKNLYKFDVFKPLSSVISNIREPIYLSIDVDVLDPGVLPAVSTPEPGGVSYQELIKALLLFKDKKILGADIVEYNPFAASPYASGSTVAEILRELILIVSKGQ